MKCGKSNSEAPSCNDGLNGSRSGRVGFLQVKKINSEAQNQTQKLVQKSKKGHFSSKHDEEVIIKVDGVKDDNTQLFLEDRQPSVDFIKPPRQPAIAPINFQ